MLDIAVVGSLNLDTTLRVDRLPNPGETVLGSSHFDDTGGKGANQAVAAARLGRSVAMVGVVGGDGAGRDLLESLRVDGVDTMQVVVDSQERSGLAVITVDGQGENMIVVDPGANGAFTPDVLLAAADPIRTAVLVLLQLEIPLDTVAAAVEMATGTVVLNPAPAARLAPEMLEGVDILVPNASELARLAGSAVPSSPGEAIAIARRIAGPGTIVVTLGAEGAVILSGGDDEHIAAPRIDPVDPTAAGDAFCGGLADALVRGESLESAVRWAVRCGAVTATRWGAQGSLPTTAEVLALEGA